MFEELQRLIALAVIAGASLDRIEEEILDCAPLDDEQRGALWLYAEALLARHREGALDDRVLASVGAEGRPQHDR